VGSDESLFEAAREVAMAGLRAAVRRVDAAVEIGVEGDRDHELDRAVTEALWWVKSLEDLWEEESGEAFYRARDASADGIAIGGLAYARNVGGHRVDRTYDEVVYRAASALESVVIASFGERWPPLSHLPALPMEDPFGRAEMYSRHVADRPLLEPFRAALAFFEDLLEDELDSVDARL